MNASLKTLIRHDGIHLLAMATITGFLLMSTIPETFIRLSNAQKKEYLKSRYRRLRRRPEELFNPDPDTDDCH